MKNLLFLILLNLSADTFTLKVNIKGFANNNGKALVGLYDAKGKMIKGLEEKITNQQVMANFSDLPSGKYAVRVFHDENNNNNLDTGTFGIPKEKWGVSNNIKHLFSGPTLQEILFEINEDKVITIQLN
jgi:uncharacterized protein (DUF2141 family)